MGKGAETKQQVLAHAVARAAVVGLQGLSIGELARDLSMSKSGLFAHFRSKSALQIQVLEYAVEQFASQVVYPSLKAPRGVARVRALMDGWLGWFDRQGESGCFFIAATTELDDQPGPARDALSSHQRDWLDTIAVVVQTAIAEGDFRADIRPDHFAQDLYGIALVLHMRARLLDEPLARADAAERCDALINRCLVSNT